MGKVTDEYKATYELVFQDDISFSRRFMAEIKVILDQCSFGQIRDNEGTELDFKGADLTIMPLQIGVRVRRQSYKWMDQFTQDDKERMTMSCDIYFLGYANKDEKGLDSYMIWDGKDYATHRDNGDIPVADRKQNTKHSLVWFNCYNNSDIKRFCRIYKTSEGIGDPKSISKGAKMASLILSLSQCHLNPGWNVTRQKELFDRYHVYTINDWEKLTLEQLESMAIETTT